MRLKRYHDKIAIVEKRQGNISSWIHQTDEKSVLALYKAFQEIVEAFTDICAMILKDMKELVKDDYANIDRLSEMNIFDRTEAELLKESNGLRNRLIHEYNGLERSTALQVIHDINKDFDVLIEHVKTWIKKHNNE